MRNKTYYNPDGSLADDPKEIGRTHCEVQGNERMYEVSGEGTEADPPIEPTIDGRYTTINNNNPEVIVINLYEGTGKIILHLKIIDESIIKQYHKARTKFEAAFPSPHNGELWEFAACFVRDACSSLLPGGYSAVQELMMNLNNGTNNSGGNEEGCDECRDSEEVAGNYCSNCGRYLGDIEEELEKDYNECPYDDHAVDCDCGGTGGDR